MPNVLTAFLCTGAHDPSRQRARSATARRTQAEFPRRGIVKSANQERFGGSRFRGFLKRKIRDWMAPMDRSSFVIARVFDEFLINPAPAIMPSPNLTGQQASRDRSSGKDHGP
jgi:hypothetical protein